MCEKPGDPDGSVSAEPFELSGPAALDVLFDALSDGRRRHVLRCLKEYDDPMTLADLADEVAVRERGTPLSDISAEAVKRVYVSLYHNHVPKLEDADVVEYSQERDMVALTSDDAGLDGVTESVS